MNENILTQFERAKVAVQEIETKRAAHLQRIDEVEARLVQAMSKDNLRERAAVFFTEGSAVNSVQSMKDELRTLQSERELYDEEITRRKEVVDALRGEHSGKIFDGLRERDRAIKRRMAEALVALAKAARDETALVDEISRQDGQPTAEFRVMRPPWVGFLSDGNSFINSWLRELREHYPNVRVEK